MAAKLSTIRKVDDFPLFFVDYEGNYRLHELLRRPPLSDEEARRFYMETARKLSEEDPPPMRETAAGTGPWPRASAMVGAWTEGLRFLAHSVSMGKRPVFLVRTRPMNAFASISLTDAVTANPFGYRILGQAAMLSPFCALDGMNDRGFAVAFNGLPPYDPPEDPERGNIGALQALRLLMDYASSVPHAIQLLDRYNVRPLPAGGHFLLADASGKSAVVGFRTGKMRVLDMDRSWNVLGNFPLEEGKERRGRESGFDRLSDLLSASDGQVAREELFKEMGSHEEGSSAPRSLWTVVYELNTRSLRVSLGGEGSRVFRFQMR